MCPLPCQAVTVEVEVPAAVTVEVPVPAPTPALPVCKGQPYNMTYDSTPAALIPVLTIHTAGGALRSVLFVFN